METITIRQFGMTALKVVPWMKLTDDTMFIVEMNRIITMTEVNDSSIIKIYQKYIRERNKISSKSQLSSNMGFISSIADARVSLEKIYENHKEIENGKKKIVKDIWQEMSWELLLKQLIH